MGVTLYLVHLSQLDYGHAQSAERTARERWATAQLHLQAKRVTSLVPDLRVERLDGPPIEALHDFADSVRASMVIVSADQRIINGSGARARLGEALAATLSVPVLLVRAPGPWTAWTRGEVPVIVMLALKSVAGAGRLRRSVERLCTLGPTDVTVVHLKNTQEPSPLDVSSEALPAAYPSWRSYVSEARFAYAGDDLHVLAKMLSADLLVLGSHRSHGDGSRKQEAVLRRLLHSRFSILSVPYATPLDLNKSDLEVVLAATDFSEWGDAAISLAHRLLKPGGAIHVLHILPAATASHDDARRRAEEERAHDALGGLVTKLELEARDVRLHVVRAEDVAERICAVAHEVGADALCLGLSTETRGAAPERLGLIPQRVLSLAPCKVVFAEAKQ